MKKAVLKLVLMVLAAWISIPVASWASEEDLQKKIDKLSKEVDELTGQVKKTEEKSLGKWLTIGGSYRFRVDSLHGRTVPYTDAIGTMNNLVRGIVDPTTGNTTGGFVNTVAGTIPGPTGIGGFISPSGTQFLMMGKSGVLFTPDMFNVILNQYMPQAMAAQMPGIMTQVFAGTTPAALTAQQTNILGTLTTKVMPIVFPMQLSTIPTMQATLTGLGMWGATRPVLDGSGGGPVTIGAATTIRQLMSTFSPAQQQTLFTALMQSFLGASNTFGANKTNLSQIPAFKPQNESLITNRFGIDLKAKATQDVTVNARLLMYKVFGSQTDTPAVGNFFADRVGVFDGILSHTPSSSLLNVDRAYATWSNIAGQPIWLSLGRRPSTNGAPSNLKLNNPRPGNAGNPALLIDFAFDGGTLGWAPDIDFLPGAYAKLCAGRGFDSGIKTPSNSLKDTDFLGVAIIPVDTDPLRIWFQWMRPWDIFDFPVMSNTIFGNTAPATSLGTIDWYGIGSMSTIKKVGPGDLNFFTDFGMSVTHAGGNVSQNAGFQGLMTGAFFAQEAPSDKTGYAAYVGIRYDLPSRTKLGFEYNHGSKNWITFAPAADDMWTSKVGTRGNVYEPYIIQELDLKPISSYLSKAFFKIGYQYYDFEYTGSNNWVGAPVKISDVKPTDLMLLAPVKEAHDIYGTFEVHF